MLTRVITLILPSDIVFVDTRGDINVYATADESSTTGCGPTEQSGNDVKHGCCCSVKLENVSQPPRPNFDANEWVGKSRITVSFYNPEYEPLTNLIAVESFISNLRFEGPSTTLW